MNLKEIVEALPNLTDRERNEVSYRAWLLNQGEFIEDYEFAAACGLEMALMLDRLEAEDEARKFKQITP